MRAMLLGICLWVVALALPLSGQTFGEITGEVTDSTSGVVVGATVTITNPQTNFTRQATTNTAGNYSFPRAAARCLQCQDRGAGFPDGSPQQC
jgi:Carboxypeptidase regulatory-like domain